MAKTEVPGKQVRDSSITEADLFLNDVVTWNATVSRHGLMPKLDGNTTSVLRGDGTWGSVAPGGSAPMPTDTYFVSPGFTGLQPPYFRNINDLMSHLDQNQPGRPIGILVYSAVYTDSPNIRYSCSINALGRVGLGTIVSVTAPEVHVWGAFKFGGLDISSGSYVRFRASIEGVAGLNVSGDIDAAIEAHSVNLVESDSGALRLKCGYVQDMILRGQPDVRVEAEFVQRASISDSSKLTIVNANIGYAGTITDSPVVCDGQSKLKLENCRVEGGNYPAIQVLSIERLILSNVTLLSDNTYCIESQYQCDSFIRGSCTINQPNRNVNLLNQVENFVLEPDAAFEDF